MLFAINSASGDLSALKFLLEEEGHETNPMLSDDEVKFVIEDPVDLSLFLKPLGVTRVDKKPTHFISRWYDGSFWGNQVLLGIPLPTMMNDDLGAEVPSGLAMRFISQSPLSVHFTNQVKTFIDTRKYVGWVTFQMHEGEVCGLQIGLPGYGWYNVLEYIKGPIGEWLASPKPLIEYWTVGVLVSLSPYPSDEEVRTHIPIAGGDHIQVFHATKTHNEVYACTRRLFYSTGWDRTIARAGEFAYAPARRLMVRGKQYRTDAVSYCRTRYSEIKQFV